jgi:hypothetical protein
MIPANGAPHDLEARDVHRSLPFAQRRARDNSTDQLKSHDRGVANSARFVAE